jgi:hypothetical protein
MGSAMYHIAFAWLLIFLSTASADELRLTEMPPTVVNFVSETFKCEKDEGELKPGPKLYRHVDINGDGLADFVFDFSYPYCSKMQSSGLCGTGGCSLTIFLATPDGAVQALDDLLLGYTLFKYKGYAVISAQGKYGASFLKLSEKPPVKLKRLPPGGQKVE